MASRIYRPNPQVAMTPIEGLRFYADALRGDWGSIDGRGEKQSLNEYIDWAATVEETTEAEVLPKLEEIFGVYVVETFEQPDYHNRRGMWAWHCSEEIEARDEEAGR